jgi:hypothetical protein
MPTINKNSPPEYSAVKEFLSAVDFKLPAGFMDFFKESDGAEIIGEDTYYDLWPLTEMVELNDDYDVEAYADNFFIFGSDGGDTAYCIEKSTGFIFEMPFIGMDNDEATLKYKSFTELLKSA